MSSAHDMSQYQELFLQEGREQLEILEQETVKLEQEPSDERMNTIFRAAHTLKGASRAMGYGPIADLTHEMENVLDLLRSHQLQLSTDIADALLASVDSLVAMCDDVEAGSNGSGAANDALVQRLKGLANPSAAAAAGEVPKLEVVTAPALPEEVEMGLQAAHEAGIVIYHAKFELAEDCILKFARAFMALNVVNEAGELLHSIPSAEDLEDENFERQFELYFCHEASAEQLQNSLEKLVETKLLSFEAWSPSAGPAASPVEAVAEVAAVVEEAPKAEAAPAEPAAAVSPEPKEAAKPKAAEGAKKTESGQTVRVDVARLDELMNLVGELVIDRTRVSQLLSVLGRRYANDPELTMLNEVASHVNRVGSSLQEHLMQARMLPIETVYARLPRMVRDLSQKLGKPIKLDLLGGETELDRSVIEVVGDPLIHILRNSVDHGIEKAEVRAERGKPAEGQVRVSAWHESSSLVIEISDDGGGINASRLKAKAVQNGLMTQTAADQMPDKEAYHLIFASGMSTAEQVSDTSGRGVGMDIVRSNIQKLGGLIELESEMGVGTTFRLRLPLTLAIIRGLLVRVSGNVYVLPLTSVVETLIVQKSDIKKRHKSEVIIVRGLTTPLLRLNRIFPIENKKEHSVDDRHYVVIVGSAEQRVALMVDGLIGEQEVVIKPIGKICGQLPGLSGATILGDGSVALICDLNSLLNGHI